MGMDYQAVVVVGLPRAALEDHEQFEEFCAGGVLEQIDPYYDGGEYAIFGVVVKKTRDYTSLELTESLDAGIAAAKAEFKEKTGLDGAAYLTPRGY